MEHLFEFIGNHWALSTALVVITIAIIANEVLLLLQAGHALEPEQATQLYNRDDAVFVDLRSENAYLTAHLPGAVNLPLAHLEQQTEKLKQYAGRPVILYDESGYQARKAGSKLKKLGMENVYQLRGGLDAWRGAGLPTKSK
ncbi:MAG: rhodanese-like domain-containing protein [Nitrococcus mobilis]|nr:rhodanese-like domain-containing protein [Nitrococcus mobilis]